MEFLSGSAKSTQAFAKNLSKKILKKSLIDSAILALTGDLGAGKTTFTQGFAKGLGIKEKIISPTFILMRQHKVPGSKKIFYHLDLYRLTGEKDFENLGLKDLFDDKNNIILIEWAEKIEKLLPQNSIKIHFEKISDQKRCIHVYN